MSGNPMLVHTPFGLVPAPFPTEWIAAERKGVEVSVSGLAGSEWRQKGSVFLSNFRMVFVSERPDAKSGLHAVELPLVYLMHVSFNQPIFGCNNMSGECKILLPNGDEASPMQWKLRFMTGGAGTFLSLFNSYVQGNAQRPAGIRPPLPAVPQTTAGVPRPSASFESEEPVQKRSAAPSAPPAPPELLRTALVDPADPTRIFLTEQPVAESQRLKEAPKFVMPHLL